MTRARRVLLVRLSALGDVVHALGAAEALALARPELELHFVVQRAFAPLLAGLPYLASVVRHERRPPLRGLVRTAGRLRRLGPDVALDLQGNWKSAAVCVVSGAGQRIGARAGLRREAASRVLLRRSVDVAGPPHPAKLALAVVRAIAPEAEARAPRLVAGEEEVAREARALRSLGLDPERPLATVVLSAPGDPRGWRGSAAARAGASLPMPVLWLAGPAEAAVEPPAPGPVLRHGPGELRRLVALGVLLARSGGLAIGPDRGATHVLAAAGARTRVLFGPQDPRRTAPVGAEILTASEPPPCAPCRRRSCSHPDGPVCMDFGLAAARPAGVVLPAGELRGGLLE